MSAGNDHLSDKNKKGKYVDGKQNQDDKPSQAHEHGDIFFFFFYRLKIAAREVRGIHDIRRFFYGQRHRGHAAPYGNRRTERCRRK
jgi:hypothetical protein